MCPCKLIKSALLFTNPVLKNMLGKMRKRKEKEKRDLIFDSIENKYTIKINNTSKLTHTCKFSEKVPFKDFYFFKSVVRHTSKKDL